MLVDNAIVVAEGMLVRMNAGMPAPKAASETVERKLLNPVHADHPMDQVGELVLVPRIGLHRIAEVNKQLHAEQQRAPQIPRDSPKDLTARDMRDQLGHTDRAVRNVGLQRKLVGNRPTQVQARLCQLQTPHREMEPDDLQQASALRHGELMDDTAPDEGVRQIALLVGGDDHQQLRAEIILACQRGPAAAHPCPGLGYRKLQTADRYQQGVGHIRVGLVDFINEHDGAIGIAAWVAETVRMTWCAARGSIQLGDT